MRVLHQGFRGVGEVLADTARALLRHWPILGVLYLAGAAGRMGVLWLATWVSDRSPTAAVLLVPLASLLTLIALVVMIRVAGEGLAAFPWAGASTGSANDWRSHWQVATAVLIPFLAVYSTQGLLRDDTVQFVHDTTLDEAVSQPLTADYSRALIASGWPLLLIVGLALVLRRVIAGYGLVGRSWRWAALGGYVEALWMVTLAASLASHLDAITEWVRSRVVVATVTEWWENLLLLASPVSGPLVAIRDGVGALLGDLGDLVVVPVAWLAMGATILGGALTPPSRAAAGRPTAEEELPEPERSALRRLADRLPEPLWTATGNALEPITSPIQSTRTAIGKVAVAGVVPMVLVCLVFVSATLVQSAVTWIARGVIGPQAALAGAAYQPIVSMVARGCYFVLVATLLAAAVNRIILAQRAASR